MGYTISVRDNPDHINHAEGKHIEDLFYAYIYNGDTGDKMYGHWSGSNQDEAVGKAVMYLIGRPWPKCNNVKIDQINIIVADRYRTEE